MRRRRGEVPRSRRRPRWRWSHRRRIPTSVHGVARLVQRGQISIDDLRQDDEARCMGIACAEPAIAECKFELKGPRAGERCGRSMCGDHGRVIAGRFYCGAHSQLVEHRLRETIPHPSG